MVIIGLGSNLDNKLHNLRLAYSALKKMPDLIIKRVSPIYISAALLPENAPADWDEPYLNTAIACDTSLEPLSLLHALKKIEAHLGRKPIMRHWGPRIIDIDILAWDDVVFSSEALTLPHPHLTERPFALWPLADVAPFWVYPGQGQYAGKCAAEIAAKFGSRFDGLAPLQTRQINQRLEAPQLVGILNITADSFSDGGQFVETENALQQAIALVDAGADVIDIGAESTAPNAKSITPSEEWARLEPILQAIKEASSQFIISPLISVDTYHPETASKAIDFGIDWLNDVTGLTNPAMLALVANSTVDCVMMHHLSIPASRSHLLSWQTNAVTHIYDWAERQIEQLVQAGVAKERIIFDPGIGFGKRAEQSLTLLKNASYFESLGVRQLIGHSRKSFLSLFTQAPASQRDIETTAISLMLAAKSVAYLRIHDVKASAQALKVQAALR